MASSRRLVKIQTAAIRSIEERMARIEQALGIDSETPSPDPLPEGGEGELDSTPETPSVKWDDLGGYTLAQLREIAATHEIDLSGSRTKDEVVQAVLQAAQGTPPQTPPQQDGEENGESETGAEG